MITKDTYFVKFEDGKAAWLSPDKEIPDGVIDKELRVMLFPDYGKVLKHKATGEISDGIWLKDTATNDYEEIDRPTDQETMEE